MKENILNIQDNYVYYRSCKTNKIYVEKVNSNCVKFGKVSDPALFYNELIRCLKKNHLITSFFMESIIVIIHNNYTKVDKIILNDILNKINYKSIKFVKDYTLINIKQTKAYIQYNNEYTIVYTKNNYNKLDVKFIDNKLFDDNSFKQYLQKFIKAKDKYIFGINKKLQEIFNQDNEYYYVCIQTVLIDNIFNMKRVK